MNSWEAGARTISQAGVDGLDRFHVLGRHAKHMRAADEALTALDRLEGPPQEHPLQPAVAVMRALVASAEADDRTQEQVARAGLLAITTQATTYAAAGAVPLATLAQAVLVTAQGSNLLDGMATAACEAIYTQVPGPWSQEVASLSATPVAERLALLAEPLPVEGRALAQAAPSLAQHVAPAERAHLAQWLAMQTRQAAATDPSLAPTAALVEQLAHLGSLSPADQAAATLAALQALAQPSATPATVALAFSTALSAPAPRIEVARMVLGSGTWAEPLQASCASDTSRARLYEEALRLAATGQQDPCPALERLLAPPEPDPAFTSAVLGSLRDALAHTKPARALDLASAHSAATRLGLTVDQEAALSRALLAHPTPNVPTNVFLGALLQVSPSSLESLQAVATLAGEKAQASGEASVAAGTRLLADLDVSVLGSDPSRQATTLRTALSGLAGAPTGSVPAAVSVVADAVARLTPSPAGVIPVARAAASALAASMDPSHGLVAFVQRLDGLPTRYDADRALAVLAGLEAASRGESVPSLVLSALKHVNPAGDRNAIIQLALDEMRHATASPVAAAVLEGASSMASCPELRDWPRARVGRALLEGLSQSSSVDATTLARAGSSVLAAAGPGLQKAVGALLVAALGKVAQADAQAAFITDVLAQAAPGLAQAGDEAAYVRQLESTLAEIVRLNDLSRMARSAPQGGEIRQEAQEVVIGGIRVPVRTAEVSPPA